MTLRINNIFLYKNGKVKLGDFGAAHALDTYLDDDKTNTTIGDRKTMAPEVYFRKSYNQQCDIYSLGAVLFQLLYLKLYVNYLDKSTMDDIKFDKREGMSDELYNLLRSMLVMDPEKRITLDKIFEDETIMKNCFKMIKKFSGFKNGQIDDPKYTHYEFEKDIERIDDICAYCKQEGYGKDHSCEERNKGGVKANESTEGSSIISTNSEP